MERNISVLMSVYKNDKPEYLAEAVESVCNQTLKAKQIVLVVDGPVNDEINKTIKELEQKYLELEVYPIEENVGLGKALAYGTEKCKYDYIARMDSDDIAVPDRFEEQIKCFEVDQDLDMVGSSCQEFFETINNMANIRAVPEKHEDIIKFMQSRNPFCHMTVMMKKESLLKAGGYKHWHFAEDWFMWIRMCLSGAKFYNIQRPLVFARINYATFERRGGIRMYKSIKNLLRYMKDKKMIGFIKYAKEKIRRFIGHVLIPKKMKKNLYMKFMRKKAT